ncbi:nucleoside phosphatase family-domain-containing protein [Fomitopsis serialis]|uniref:nucleoside phosphatase family-domain-containing protein n=1 Tax=Fomitopsis serialis TaxID=139415 RepID=UPI002008C0A8|nr:nucleoside phosphatase family-domain-containing protein [Neoantrodia serialis]KAH9936434.1 nucleoside phosphatase family-domain-containing protein [Neoantrodia serialis]
MFGVRSPTTSNYERLEGGHGVNRTGSALRFAGWKKFALAAVLIVGLVYVFGHRKENIIPHEIPSYLRPDWSGGDKSPLPPVVPDPIPVPVHDDDMIPQPPPGPPTGPENDPDLSKTIHCIAPYKPSLPLVQYALMIDAGSTGSRIHIYKFNNCGPSPVYEYEVFRMTQPGLSSYSGRPQEAAQSLDVLLDEAVKIIPKALQSCTPVQVKATAGLRLLGAAESAAILDAVKAHLHTRYPFSLKDDDGVVIMDGKDEGVYAWITANYLLNTIRGDSPAGTPSYAVLDLGGASTQIVFEPVFGKPDSTLEPGEHKYDLAFGGKTRVLYQHSYLGYGLMRARQSVHRLVEFMGSLRGTGSGANATVANPCLARGTRKAVDVEDAHAPGGAFGVTMLGADVGGFAACNRVVELVMAKDALCEVKPCAFDGVYQPSLMETFPAGKVLLLSYFYDRLQPFLDADPALAKAPLSVSTFATLAQQVCLGKPSWTQRWGANAALMAELEGRPEWCLDLTFMHALLRLGYELDGGREVQVGKKIEGTELGWCLGATLALVGGDIKCRV